MGKRIDLVGQKFNLLTVKSYYGRVGKNAAWNCLCDCGNEKVVLGFLLKNGDTKSCGCYYQSIKNLPRSHGYSRSREYHIWQNMKRRCQDTEQSDYGGRGISYDPRWETFEGFWEDMQEGYSDVLELDREDVNMGYFKENCRWVDKSTQQYNRRRTPLNTSGRTGVSWNKQRMKWEVYITVKKEFIKIGFFDDFEEAVQAREFAEIKYFGEVKKYA